MTDRCKEDLEQDLVLLVFLLQRLELVRKLAGMRVTRVTITKRTIDVNQFRLDSVRFRRIVQRRQVVRREVKNFTWRGPDTRVVLIH